MRVLRSLFHVFLRKWEQSGKSKYEYTKLERLSSDDNDNAETETGIHDENYFQPASQIHDTNTVTITKEAKAIAKNATPVFLALILEYSLSIITVITVGKLGTVELGAASLASFTANATGYSVYYGLATSLDTLCSQAYGSGMKHLCCVHLQRMGLFLTLVTIPLAALWWCAEGMMVQIIPEQDTAVLVGSYLRIAVFGMPGYAAFESGRRYIQAQGCYSVGMYVLLICTPISAVLNWFFVWVYAISFLLYLMNIIRWYQRKKNL